MLKAAGLLGIVLSLGLLGILKSQELKQRIALLQDFWQMMLQLKSEINYLQEPLQSVLRQRPGNAESKAMQLLPAVQQALDAKQGDLQTVWKQSAETVYKGTPLTAQDLQLVCYPGTFLGQTDCENQARQFQYLETRLQVQLQEAEEVYRTKGPLQRRIGFFARALLAVVLL